MATALIHRTGPFTSTDADAIHALAQTAATADGVQPLSEQPLLWLTGAGPAIHHLTLGDPRSPIGYAQLDLRDPTQASAELVVHPGHRRRGLGTTLIDALANITDHVGLWAHGDLPPARALARNRRLPAVRELWQMRLDPLAAPAESLPTPSELRIRPFRPGQDEDAWLALNTAAFAHHPEQGRFTRADLDAREAEPWFDPAGFLLAESVPDGRLLAAGWTKISPGDDTGEIYVLGVHPDAQGRGLGRLLTNRMLTHLVSRGLRAALLYTEGDNIPAIRTYQRAGFSRSAVHVVYRL